MDTVQHLEKSKGSEALLDEIDSAFREDDKKRLEVRTKRGDSSVMEERMAVLPKVLRFLGSLVLIASTLVFLLQGWDSASYVMRYYYFLLFTGALTVSGFVCGLRVKEDKGARTFLALAVAIIPAHFAQLGAFMYSGFGNPVHLERYPGFALWLAPDPYTALQTAGVALVVLLPIMYLGFTTLVRRSAWQLSSIYSVACALLLIPTRDPLLIGMMTLGLAAGVSIFERKQVDSSSHMKTKEALLARLMLWTPVVILVTRNIMLYGVDMYLLGLASLAVAAFMFICLGNILKGDDGALQKMLAMVPLGFGWMLIALEIIHDHNLADEFVLPMISLPLTAILLVMAEKAGDMKRLFRGAAIVVSTLGMGLNLFISPNLITAFITLLIGMGSVIYGYAIERKYHCLVGLGLVLSSLGYYIGEAVDRFSVSPWMSLAVLGVLTIFLASFIERNHKQLQVRLLKMRDNVKSWN